MPISRRPRERGEPDRVADLEDRGDHQEHRDGDRPGPHHVHPEVDRLEHRAQVAHRVDALQALDRALHALELLRVLELDPVGLLHVGGPDRLVDAPLGVVVRDVGGLPLVVGLLLGLQAHRGDLVVGAEHLLDLLLLRVGDLTVDAVGGRGVLVAQEDRDLELAAPVVLGLVRLGVQQQPHAHQGERHEDRDDHRDGHGDVALEPVAELGEDVGELHEVSGSVSSLSAGSRRRRATGRGRRCRWTVR